MLNHRPANQRGHNNFGWLDANHSFSFGDYYDPNHMGFSDLRVINEDRVQPGMGFPTHPHRDMEILTYILDGALEHKDSMGNGSVIRPGELQYMSAGSGITHSEFNHSKSEIVHLLQIWVLPNQFKAQPRYDQRSFSREEKLNRLRLIASENGADGSIAIRQNCNLYASLLETKKNLLLPLNLERRSWIQMARGEILVNGISLKAGDGLAIAKEKALEILGQNEISEFLFFDLN